jgi:L-serine dehydratase
LEYIFNYFVLRFDTISTKLKTYMETISVFDMLKIGVGPSSSHTLGPWKAAQLFLKKLDKNLKDIESIKINLYGSLSLTGKGHATDVAVLLGLQGHRPEDIDTEKILTYVEQVKKTGRLLLNGEKEILFSFENDILFNNSFLKFHPNALTITAAGKNFTMHETYYSVGGGFVLQNENGKHENSNPNSIPFPIQNGLELLNYTKNRKISEVVFENELALNSRSHIETQLEKIWLTMLECVKKGCSTEGILPGGLHVKRRAKGIYTSLNGPVPDENNALWLSELRSLQIEFGDVFKWVSCFAMAVNEQNANMGRVVTAPTNGSVGVIPSAIMYYLMFENKTAGLKEIKQFFLVAGEIGSIFKKGATISAAMGGCQAEIGVSAAMAAAALTELLEGSPEQVLVAAEIAMEHHLGLTCDPIAGLVQIPCIERNSMGAIKAITASKLALETNPKDAKVPLDKVIATMWQTAKDMNHKYKETSKGGLAVAVNISDC